MEGPARLNTLVGVGTVRIFIDAALNPNVGHVVFTERDPMAINFIRIHLGLLKISKLSDTADFRSLWNAEDFSAWQKRSPRGVAEALTREDFDWWKENVQLHDRKIPAEHFSDASPHIRPNFKQLLAVPEASPDSPFHGANYLHNPEQLGRLQALALSGNMKVQAIDLSSEVQVSSLVSHLQDQGRRVIQLDLSNAFWDEFLGARRTMAIIDQFIPLMPEQGLVVMTTRKRGVVESDPRFPEIPPTRAFGYFATQAKEFQNPEARANLALNLKYMTYTHQMPQAAWGSLNRLSARSILYYACLDAATRGLVDSIRHSRNPPLR